MERDARPAPIAASTGSAGKQHNANVPQPRSLSRDTAIKVAAANQPSETRDVILVGDFVF